LAQSKFGEAEIALRRALELLPESDSAREEVQQSLADCQDRLKVEREGLDEPPGG
jgi:hypothetical protein